MWGNILASAAPALISGIFGRGRSRAQGVDFQKLRDDAQAAGFNPLTALMATGASGYQRDFNPALSSGSFIAEAVGRGVDTYFNAQQRAEDAEADRIRREEDRAFQRELVQSARVPETFGYDVQSVAPFQAQVESADPVLSRQPAGPGRPLARPTPDDNRRPAYDPFGNIVMVPGDVLERLGIRQYGSISPGDWAELVGEVGEIETGANNFLVRQNMLGHAPVTAFAPRGPLRGTQFANGAAPVPRLPLIPPQSYPPDSWRDPWGH